MKYFLALFILPHHHPTFQWPAVERSKTNDWMALNINCDLRVPLPYTYLHTNRLLLFSLSIHWILMKMMNRYRYCVMVTIHSCVNRRSWIWWVSRERTHTHSACGRYGVRVYMFLFVYVCKCHFFVFAYKKTS